MVATKCGACGTDFGVVNTKELVARVDEHFKQNPSCLATGGLLKERPLAFYMVGE